MSSLTKSQQFWQVMSTSSVNSVPTAPLPLPSPFEWTDISIQTDADLQMLEVFLSKHFGNPGSFSIIYSPEYIKWAFNDQHPFLTLGIRYKNTLVGFCKGWSIQMMAGNNPTPQSFLVTSFLCIHSKYRGKNLVDVLLKEMVRRMLSLGVRHGITISPKDIYQPSCYTRYYNRFLKPVELMEKKYIYYPNLTPSRARKLYSVPEWKERHFHLLLSTEVKELSAFLNQHLNRFQLRQHYDEKETCRIFIPTEGVNRTMVSKGPDVRISNMFSYHILTFQKESVTVKAAYVLYVLGNNLLDSYEQLMADAYGQGCELVVAFDHMDFDTVRDALKFKESPKVMKYFLFNYNMQLGKSDLGFTWI